MRFRDPLDLARLILRSRLDRSRVGASASSMNLGRETGYPWWLVVIDGCAMADSGLAAFILARRPFPSGHMTYPPAAKGSAYGGSLRDIPETVGIWNRLRQLSTYAT